MPDNPVLDKIHTLIKQAGDQNKAAESLEISPSLLSLILAGKRDISDNLARKLGYLRAPTEWVPIRPDTALAVSADGIVHGDQIGECFAQYDAKAKP